MGGFIPPLLFVFSRKSPSLTWGSEYFCLKWLLPKMRIMLAGALFVLIVMLLFVSCGPIREFHKTEMYEGNMFPALHTPRADGQKKTVLIIADNVGTEIFDLLAPFNIFSMSHRLNVFIAGPEKKPIPLWKGVFVLPHLSYREAEDIPADLIVVPAMLRYNDTAVINLIKRKKTSWNFVLSVCEGSRTVCETGLYTGKRITSHASSLKRLRRKYPDMKWVQGKRFVSDGFLFSTSGVSSAVEGALRMTAILLDSQTMHEARDAIQYPARDVLQEYDGKAAGAGDKLHILGKTIFQKNKDVCVYLHDGIDELLLGAVLDSYNRTFPRSLKTICSSNRYVRSRNGLVLFPAGDTASPGKIDELHVLSPVSELPLSDQQFIGGLQEKVKRMELLCYSGKKYIFSEVLERIRKKYGKGFQRTVSRLLDYPAAIAD